MTLIVESVGQNYSHIEPIPFVSFISKLYAERLKNDDSIPVFLVFNFYVFFISFLALLINEYDVKSNHGKLLTDLYGVKKDNKKVNIEIHSCQYLPFDKKQFIEYISKKKRKYRNKNSKFILVLFRTVDLDKYETISNEIIKIVKNEYKYYILFFFVYDHNEKRYYLVLRTSRTLKKEKKYKKLYRTIQKLVKEINNICIGIPFADVTCKEVKKELSDELYKKYKEEIQINNPCFNSTKTQVASFLLMNYVIPTIFGINSTIFFRENGLKSNAKYIEINNQKERAIQLLSSYINGSNLSVLWLLQMFHNNKLF